MNNSFKRSPLYRQEDGPPVRFTKTEGKNELRIHAGHYGNIAEVNACYTNTYGLVNVVHTLVRKNLATEDEARRYEKGLQAAEGGAIWNSLSGKR